LEDSAFSNSTRNTNIPTDMKKDPVTTLFKLLLAEHDGFLKELAPGIIVYYREKKTPRSGTKYHVVWDPSMWRLGNKNPDRCYLILEFGLLFDNSGIHTGRSLVQHLQTILTPLNPDFTFHSHFVNLKVDTVTVSPNQSQ
jgi:hypothetical protein